VTRNIFPFLAILIFSLPVFAGHYPIDSIQFPFPLPVKQLQKNKVHTTLDLWKSTRTKKQQRSLAGRLHLSLTRVQRFHDFCDLLRVRGIGPKVATVMQAAGIKNAAALAKADPKALNERVKQTNKHLHVLGKLPGIEIVRWWVHYASSLK